MYACAQNAAFARRMMHFIGGAREEPGSRRHDGEGQSVGTKALFGLMFCLLIVAYSQVVGAPGWPEVLPEPVTLAGSKNLPADFSGYVRLHRTRYESTPIHILEGVNVCLR
jgi:hypothetical protein